MKAIHAVAGASIETAWLLAVAMVGGQLLS